ncbi:uncharacterized protein LOC123896275 [Trifolium pratense]|uniref:uncharacterized protein LOC123896275 n=1 Tax=Trifolium pratense TaxID=57577 RepID=UPI001E69830E|nr:uncharacterized protein LOC123896275 [Trifolium pratense]
MERFSEAKALMHDICTNEEREVAGTAWDIGSHSIIEAEAMAMLEAMKAAIHLHMERISFESDSLIVVKAVHAKHSGSSEFNLLIDNIKNLLVLNPKFELKFVKRQANSVAHLLAKAANSWTRRCLFYVIPPCIENHFLTNVLRTN